MSVSPTDASTLCALIRHGLVPNAPNKPSYAISIRALEIYRITHLRSPHLAIEPFVKSLCDVYGVPYRASLREVFSTSYDLYLSLRDGVDSCVLKALGRDGLWRRKNACPACSYRLEGEEDLLFSMLVTMDGNDSLKRIIRRALKESQAVDDEDQQSEDAEDGRKKTAAGPSIEREDGRTHKGLHYIEREATKKFEDDEATQEDTDETDEESPCQGRWQNMEKEVTERAWGIFDETGIFLCLCRHGFVVALLDMVQSGELCVNRCTLRRYSY